MQQQCPCMVATMLHPKHKQLFTKLILFYGVRNSSTYVTTWSSLNGSSDAFIERGTPQKRPKPNPMKCLILLMMTTMGVCLLWYFAPIKFGPHTAMIHMFIGWNHRPIRWLEWFGRQTLFILHNTYDFFNYQFKNRQTLFGTLVFFQGLP